MTHNWNHLVVPNSFYLLIGEAAFDIAYYLQIAHTEIWTTAMMPSTSSLHFCECNTEAYLGG